MEYQHQPLPTPTSIRLIKLNPGQNSDDYFSCSIVLADILNPPEYIALSYVWGGYLEHCAHHMRWKNYADSPESSRSATHLHTCGQMRYVSTRKISMNGTNRST